MPKIGAPKDAAERPYVTVCGVCGCRVEKVVSRFLHGPAAWAYLCQNWRHLCGTAEREGCKPKRLHCTCSTGSPANYEGPAEDCPVHGNPEIVPHLRNAAEPEGGHAVIPAGYGEGVTVSMDDIRTRDLGHSDATGPGVPEGGSGVVLDDVWDALPDDLRCAEVDFETGDRCGWPVWPEHRRHSFETED